MILKIKSNDNCLRNLEIQGLRACDHFCIQTEEEILLQQPRVEFLHRLHFFGYVFHLVCWHVHTRTSYNVKGWQVWTISKALLSLVKCWNSPKSVYGLTLRIISTFEWSLGQSDLVLHVSLDAAPALIAHVNSRNKFMDGRRIIRKICQIQTSKWPPFKMFISRNKLHSLLPLFTK